MLPSSTASTSSPRYYGIHTLFDSSIVHMQHEQHHGQTPSTQQAKPAIIVCLHSDQRLHLTPTSATDRSRLCGAVQTILGETRPLEQRFEETLAQSVKRALYYLHVRATPSFTPNSRHSVGP